MQKRCISNKTGTETKDIFDFNVSAMDRYYPGLSKGSGTEYKYYIYHNIIIVTA